LREAVPTAEAFYSDAGTYVGLTHSSMAAIDSGLEKNVTVATATSGGYCLSDSVGGQDWSVAGPGAVWHKNATCAAPAVSVNA
jgi:hypothetical protein